MRRALIACVLLTTGIAAGSRAGQAPDPPDPGRQAAAAAKTPFAGNWTASLPKSKLHPDFRVRSATLQFAVTADTVTITSAFVLESGQEQQAAETFRTDGTEVAGTLSPGVTLAARWVDARTLETRAKKDGAEIGVVTYEVSADGQVLTSRSSGPAMPEQTIVFERAR